MARDFEITITEAQVGQWVQFNVPASTTGFPFFEVGQLGGSIKVSSSPTGENAKPLLLNGTVPESQTLYCRADSPASAILNDFFFRNKVVFSKGGGGGGGGTTYTFQTPLTNVGNSVSLTLANDLKVTNNALTLNLLQNQDFRNVLLNVDEAKLIASFTQVGRVKPQQNHFTINLDGSLGLDVSPTGVLATTFATQADIANKADANTVTVLEGKVTQNESDIAQLQADVVLKANSADVYTKTATDGLLNNKADLGSVTTLAGRVTIAEGNITTNTQSITRIDGEIATINQQITQLDTTKANASDVYTKNDVYTKTETNGLLSNKANLTDVVTLAGQQIITGEKDFTAEVRANNIVSEENGVGYGSVDVRRQDGYYSISRNGSGQAVDILMSLGFVDATTNVRLRNLAGGLVTFNTLLQYESTLTPTDDKDLVPLATLNQVKAELLALIQGSQGGLTFVGEISNTKDEVTLNPDLLNQFVQATESRTPKKGDFIRTSDSYGFIFNGTDWRNFGQVSVSVATTTNAGIVMLGTAAGELEDIGNGKVRVIGWQTVEQALRDLDARTTTNTTGLQTANQNITNNKSEIDDIRALVNQNITDIGLKANDADVVKLTGDQTVAGAKTFTSRLKVEQSNNPVLELKDTGGNKSCIIQTIDSGQNLQFSLPSGGAVQFNGTLRYPWNAIPTVTNDNDIPPYKQIKDEFATIANLNLKANDDAVVKLTGDQVVEGNKSLRGVTTLSTTLRMGYGGSTVIISPEDDSTKTLKFRDTSVGTNNQFNIDLENVCGLTGIKDPTSARDAVPRDWANNQYIPKVTTTATNGIQVTSNAQKEFNFDYVWDNANSGYRNWSGIKLRCKTQSASAFTDMFSVEYRNEDSLGIFMTCVSDKLTFANPTKVKGVSCEDADSGDTATSKGWVENKLTSYLKGDIIPVGGSLPAQTDTDTVYLLKY